MIDFPHANEALPPAQENAVCGMLRRKITLENYRAKRISEGRRIKDPWGKEKRRAYNADYYAANANLIREQRRARYQRQRRDKGAVSFLNNILHDHILMFTIAPMDTVSTTATPARTLEPQAAAQFLSELVGVEVKVKTLLKWAHGNRVPHQKLVGKVLFNTRELEDWLRAGKVILAGRAALEAIRTGGTPSELTIL